jgi:hypothetical protein
MDLDFNTKNFYVICIPLLVYIDQNIKFILFVFFKQSRNHRLLVCPLFLLYWEVYNGIGDKKCKNFFI